MLLKAPKSGVGRWWSSKKGRRRAPRGCTSLAFRPPGVSVFRLRGAGFSCYSTGPQFAKDSSAFPSEGFVQVYLRIGVFVHAGACPHLSMLVQMGLLQGVGECAYIYIYIYICTYIYVYTHTHVCVCVPVCGMVCVSREGLGGELRSGLELYSGGRV